MIRKPLLEFLGKDRNYHSLDECVASLSDYFQLTEEEKQKRYYGGHRRKIFHRLVTYVISDFRIAALIEDETKPRGASFRINETGLKLLESNYDVITKKTLKRFGDYSSLDTHEPSDMNEEGEEKSEEEIIQEVQEHIAHKTQVEILKYIKTYCTSEGFEKLCLRLFEEIGYGESVHTGQSGDRGVDGIISDNLLNLRDIYVQAKHYGENTISYSEVEKFYVKCIRDKVSGIFVTTTSFSSNALDEWKNDSLIKLIDGKMLSEYLWKFNVGVELDEKIEIKKINLSVLKSFN